MEDRAQSPMNEAEPQGPKRGAPAGNANARFWSRPEVETARLLLDVWATQVWHSMRMVVPIHEVVVRRIPITDARGRQIGERLAFETVSAETGRSYEIGGDNRAIAIDQRSGGEIITQHRSVSPFRDRGLCPAMEIKVMVASELESCHEWAPSLMLHIYPRSGPYHDQARNLDGFRPEDLVRELRMGYDGKDPDRYITAKLNQLHKEVVRRIIPIGQTVLGRAA